MGPIGIGDSASSSTVSKIFCALPYDRCSHPAHGAEDRRAGFQGNKGELCTLLESTLQRRLADLVSKAAHIPR